MAKLVKATTYRSKELEEREVSYDAETFGIFFNGNFNDYPQSVEKIIDKSSTAISCVNLLTSFLAGKGMPSYNKEKISNECNTFDFIEEVSNDIAKHKGVFVVVNYGEKSEIESLDIEMYKNCRIGTETRESKEGKTVKHEAVVKICDDWDGDPKAENIRTLPFHIFDQKKRKEYHSKNGIKAGVAFLNFERRNRYPLAFIHQSLDNARSEHVSQIFNQNNLDNGFMGNTIMIVPPQDDGSTNYTTNDTDSRKRQLEAKSEKENTKKVLENMKGADRAAGVTMLEVEVGDGDIDKVMKVIEVPTNIEPSLYTNIQEDIKSSIRKCYLNPAPALTESENSVFAQSGEAYTKMVQFYNVQTSSSRNKISTFVNSLILEFPWYNSEEEILPITLDNATEEIEES
jgi:hypothetical protein